MNLRKPQAIFSPAILVVLLTGFANQAYAAQINASLVPEFDKATSSFIGVKFVKIKYEPGSALSNFFNGKLERIEFSIAGTNERGMKELVDTANQALLKVESPAQISRANLTYSGVLRGELDELSLTYNVEVRGRFSGFKIDPNATDNIPMDINWRGFVIEGPLFVDSTDHGRFNVNQPIGLLLALFPDFAEKLVDSGARGILTRPILDFREIGNFSMERWHWLFDPTFSQASTGGILKGENLGRAKVMSVYSLGECSIREGCPLPDQTDAIVNIDGAPVQLRISTPQPNSQIEIAGFTGIEKTGGQEIIRVKMVNPSLYIPPFTIQVLLVLGGMMGAIALFVMLKSRK